MTSLPLSTEKIDGHAIGEARIAARTALMSGQATSASVADVAVRAYLDALSSPPVVHAAEPVAGEPRPIVWHDACATEDCMRPATERFEYGGVGSTYCKDCYAKIMALFASVGVKAIVWRKTSYDMPEAETVVGVYRINHAMNGGYSVSAKREVLRRPDGTTNFSRLQDAIDAAQSDYEQRIRSALVPLSGVTEEQVEAAAKAIYDAEDHLSGDAIAAVIISSDHLFPNKHHLEGNPTSKAYQLAAMDVCRTAARAALIAALAHPGVGMVRP